MGKKKKRKQLFFLLIFVICMILIGKQSGEKESKDTVVSQEVYAKELAGYLRIIPLTPDETRKLILPELNEVLTGSDVRLLFAKLELDSFYEEAASVAALKEDETLTRAQWTQIYEWMLDKLGLKDQVKEIQIQYLGDLTGEDRIMADSGNYDCDLESSTFSYGKVYTVYLYGNTILGRKEGDIVSEQTGENNVQTEENGDNQIAEVPARVRVLITQDNGKQPYRANVWVKGSCGMTICSGEQSMTVETGEIVVCEEVMNGWNVNALTIQPAENGNLSLTNAGGNDQGSFRGNFLIYRNQSGYWVVNELGIEEYLYGVVPGEMPESFAMEALKAQAVCARTYAARQIAGKSYEAYGADLNDTTDCQVYLPSQENQNAIDAVNATAGQVLRIDGDFAQIYYFSTSCGYTSGMEVWQQEAVPYLKKVSLLTEGRQKLVFDNFIRDQTVAAYDSHSRYFRWTAQLNLSEKSESLRNVLRQYASDTEGRLVIKNSSGENTADCISLGACTGLGIQKRSKSGTVTDLCLQFENGNVHIYNENTIRKVLGAVLISLVDKNGKTVNDMTMLPSAAFTAEQGNDGLTVLYGGGLGHGIGMSQYGADGMAREGMDYTEILDCFFDGTCLSE